MKEPVNNTKAQPACPLCGSPSAVRPAHEVVRADYRFFTKSCGLCGFEFRWPVPSPAEIEAMYGEQYYTGQAGFTYKDERPNRHYEDYVFRARIKNIRRYVSSGRFLDIGSSFGGLLDNAQPYFETFGCEISAYSSDYARRQGHQIRTGPFLENGRAPYPDNFFSVITLIEVIEHLPEAGLVWPELRRILAPGGVIAVQTANMAGRQAKAGGGDYHYYLPGHLSYYSTLVWEHIVQTHNFSNMRAFYPVDFGLWPKLMKSRMNFTKPADYLAWGRIAYYHLTGKLRMGHRAWQSSLVVYLFG